MPDRIYASHELLVGPARPYRALWRFFLGLVLIGVVIFALNSVVLGVVGHLGSGAWMQQVVAGSTPLGLLVLLGSFAFVILAVALTVRVMQHRGFLGVIGAPGQAIRQFRQVFAALVVLALVVLILPPYDMGAPLRPNLAFETWLLFLPLSLLAVLVQTSAEEILFRGYIQQSLAARFRSPIIWMVLPSALFAMGHYLPEQAGDNAWVIALWSGVFGVLMADLTARAGTLGPAIALHLFNNTIALLFIAMPGSLDGLALYLVPYGMSDTEQLRSWLVVDFVSMLLGWLVARIALRR